MYSAASLGRTCRTPQEGYDLRSGAGSVRSEQRVAHTSGNALLRRPEDCIVVVILRVHIGEEVEHGVIIHKDRLHRDLARRHDEGVLSAALVGQLNFPAVLVDNLDSTQLIPLSGAAVMVTVSPLDADLEDTVTVPFSVLSAETV